MVLVQDLNYAGQKISILVLGSHTICMIDALAHAVLVVGSPGAAECLQEASC